MKKLGLSIPLFCLLLSLWGDGEKNSSPAKKSTSFKPPVIVEEHSFINYNLNKIDYPGTDEALGTFYNKLENLIFTGEGKVNITHMGGSHVQAGTLSNTLRENFFSLSESLRGERGFFFPFRLAHTNSPWNIDLNYTGTWEGFRNSVPKHSAPWGMSGVTAITADPDATVEVWTFDSDSALYDFNRVKIFHTFDSTSYRVKLHEKFDVLSSSQDSARGFTEFVLAQNYDTLFLSLEKNQPYQDHFSFQGLKFENDENGLTYTSLGVNGASVPSYLRCEKFIAQLNLSPPDLVIFGIGINDAYMTSKQFSQSEFEANYQQLMNWIRETNPDVNFLFLTNNDSYYKRKYANRNAVAVKESMYKLARKNDAAVWDLFEIMGGLNSIYTWDKMGLAKSDKIHFTREGYRLEADLLFDAVKRDFGEYLSKK